jgi:hypothetical protein
MQPNLDEFRAFLTACDEEHDGLTDAQLAKALAVVEGEYADLKAYVEKHATPRQKQRPVEWYLQPIGNGISRMTRKAAGNIPLPGVTIG